MKAARIKLCRLHEIPNGSARGFDPLEQGTDSLFVVRRGNTVKAFHNVCPHQLTALPWRKDEYLNADGSHIMCSSHGALFDLDTGKCVQGPALGKSLLSIEATLTDDDTIYVNINTKNTEE